ncbi:cytochrome P450-like protein [Xylaria sp. CBS 124048]|nr:cytochrome P450-like protein [Xylaria sp. CBS 124048]
MLSDLLISLRLGFKCLLIVLVPYILAVIIYRLTWHPLAKYPGPLLGRITDWYIVIHSLVGDRHIRLLELHDTYGPVVRFGPNRLSINTIEGLQKIYGIKASTRKSSYYSVFSDIFSGENSLATIDSAAHSKKKKVISQALSDSAISRMEEVVLRNIRKFTERLGENDSKDEEAWGPPKNMKEWASYLAFDVMGDVCFSHSFGMLERNDYRYLLDTLSEGTNGLNIGGWMPGLFRFKIGYLLFRKVAEGLKSYQEFSIQQSERRLQLKDQTSKADVYSYMLEANRRAISEGGQAIFNPHDLVGESSLLIIAGSDTTAITITVVTFYLLHNPAAYEKLVGEIRSRFSNVEEIRGGPALNSCHWLRACIEEGMRMSPPMPGMLPREVVAPGLRIGDNFFPEGVELAVTHYAMHHNEEYYPDSFAYKPERWISNAYERETKEESERRLHLAQSAFCAFSIGSRGCVGKGLALKEVSIALARIIWMYDMRLAPGTENHGAGGAGMGRGRHRAHEQQITDMFVSKVDGPIVQFRKRAADR